MAGMDAFGVGLLDAAVEPERGACRQKRPRSAAREQMESLSRWDHVATQALNPMA